MATWPNLPRTFESSFTVPIPRNWASVVGGRGGGGRGGHTQATCRPHAGPPQARQAAWLRKAPQEGLPGVPLHSHKRCGPSVPVTASTRQFQEWRKKLLKTGRHHLGRQASHFPRGSGIYTTYLTPGIVLKMSPTLIHALVQPSPQRSGSAATILRDDEEDAGRGSEICPGSPVSAARGSAPTV